jgi:Rps23 Pro-64 3,4-dihydroxylase Tpa1-like proline 4-hydroxylase
MVLASPVSRPQRDRFPDIKSLLPLEKMEQKVDSWAREYRENRPYPHIGIDNFFDETVIQELTLDYPAASHASWQRASFDPQYEEAKLSLDRVEEFPPSIRTFIETLNSPIFLSFLERLVGIDGLIPDPYLTGGGLHMIPRGGRLGIHADFNLHKKFGLDRRLNLLLYLNQNWQPEWGGEFELWDKDVKNRVKSYLPIANRLVVFSTTDISFHGHPESL